MKTLRLALAASLLIPALVAPLQGSTLLLGAYPDRVVVFDEGKGAVTDSVKLDTGLPMSMRLSSDKKKLYITTITKGGLEVMDTASHKIVNSLTLSDGNTRYRFGGGVPDPTGRYFYAVGAKLEKGVDRYTIGKPHYMVIDLQQKKVVRTADLAAADDLPNYFRFMPMAISPDGKLLYIFRENVTVVDTATLKAVDHIELARPETTGMENITLGGGAITQQTPGEYVSLFNATDPYIHVTTFGLARLNLATRRFTYAPIGPAPTGMSGLEVSPDGKEGYTVITNGTLGNKRCEFWRFDLSTNKVIAKAEFECRSRFTLGMSGDGQKLYIYGATFDITVFDAKTLKYEKTWDLAHDITAAGMVVD